MRFGHSPWLTSPSHRLLRLADEVPLSEIFLLVANRNRAAGSLVLNRLGQSSNTDSDLRGSWRHGIVENLRICSPKRNSRVQTGWQGFFPYYAGYPETFARTLLESARLQPVDIILD